MWDVSPVIGSVMATQKAALICPLAHDPGEYCSPQHGQRKWLSERPYHVTSWIHVRASLMP